MAKGKTAVRLPVKNELGFFEIRMESIGGLGANVAGKILTEAAILGMGLNGAGFASYGSEKKGTPVKAFVRVCEADQKDREQPDRGAARAGHLPRGAGQVDPGDRRREGRQDDGDPQLP